MVLHYAPWPCLSLLRSFSPHKESNQYLFVSTSVLFASNSDNFHLYCLAKQKEPGPRPGFIFQVLFTGSILLLPPLNHKIMFFPYSSLPFIHFLISGHSLSFPRIFEKYLELFFKKMIIYRHWRKLFRKFFQNPRTPHTRTCFLSASPCNIIRKRLTQSLPHIYPNSSFTYGRFTNQNQLTLITRSILFNVFHPSSNSSICLSYSSPLYKSR